MIGNEEGSAERIKSDFVKKTIKEIMCDSMIQHSSKPDDQFEFAFSLLMQCIIELVEAAITTKETRVKLLKTVFDDIIKYLDKGE